MPAGVGPGKHDNQRRWWLQCLFPLAGSRAVPIGSGPLTVGRDRACDVAVPGREASRRHAELSVNDDGAVICDLKSLNGTFVNGSRVARKTLVSGDVVRVGDLVGLVVHGSAEDVQGPATIKVAQGFWAGPTLRAALDPVRKLSTTTLPILIEGETGTGKERVAKAVHEWSGRGGLFVGVNCAAIPEHLAEAELFGYRKGAFTGAEHAAIGHVRAAHRGTLLLDEVSDLSPKVQAKLLRCLEEREVQEVGDSKPTAVDVRIIAASRGSLHEQVQGGSFRPDLYARLNGFRLTLPRLVARKEEIPSLFVQLIEAHLGASAPPMESTLIERLLLYGWPGNVRELGLVARRLLGLHGHESKLRAEHLHGTELVQTVESDRDTYAHDLSLPRDERDVKALLRGLRKFDGNLAQASLFAKVSRQRAYRLLSQQTDLDLEALRKGKG
jgi:transcriptional regulator with PAS, ATPase and Fis domain